MSKVGIAVLASGHGTNFEALVRSIRRGDTNGEIRVLIANVPDAPVLKRAEADNIPAKLIPHREFKTREQFEQALIAELKHHDVGLVCLAGFMRILSPYFIREFPQRILNIHPALLPAFPGEEAQRQALEYGVKFSGCTVHIVDEGVDSGPIICQAVVPVLDDDTPETLAARILKEEHRIYSEAICLLLEDRVHIEGRRVRRNK